MLHWNTQCRSQDQL